MGSGLYCQSSHRLAVAGNILSMNNARKAQAEYNRLRSLIGGRHPKGDCQLVALMIARAIDGDIIDGTVSLGGGASIWHFWACREDTYIYDPLANSWDRQPTTYTTKRTVEESEVLEELRHFVKDIDYIPRNWEPIFPLRYALTHELLGMTLPGIEKLFPMCLQPIFSER